MKNIWVWHEKWWKRSFFPFKNPFSPILLCFFLGKTVKPSPFEITGWWWMVCVVMVWVMAGDGGDGFNTFLGHILSIRLSFRGHFCGLSSSGSRYATPFTLPSSPAQLADLGFPTVGKVLLTSQHRFSHWWKKSEGLGIMFSTNIWKRWVTSSMFLHKG